MRPCYHRSMRWYLALVACISLPVSLVHADLAEFRAAPAAVVTANLTGAVLGRHAGALRALVAEGGALIVSGFAVEEAPGVAAAFGATVEREVFEGEWAAVLLRLAL